MVDKQENRVVSQNLTQAEKIQHGAEDSGRYFHYMLDFVGFKPEDARAIQESALVIEKHIPSIVADFYTHLLRYPPTRVHFLKPDGSVDQEYLQKRMHHLTNFWRRTASGSYDEDYARYVDYVGRAHTSHGADPNIYIAERYVIGQVGFMQRAINQALTDELHEYNPELEIRAISAWNMVMMVILEMLSRAYEDEHEAMPEGKFMMINREPMHRLAVQTYERGLGLERPKPKREIFVAREDEIPEGERKIVQLGELSIGIFHHKGNWIALRNHCLHRGGPVATGRLEGDTLICPWHGFKYSVLTGELLVDPAVKLDRYEVLLREGEVYLTIPEETAPETLELFAGEEILNMPPDEAPAQKPSLPTNEFYVADISPGKTGLVKVNGIPVAIYNAGGTFYATINTCTHAGGPLSEGHLNGTTIVCPWHGSCFDVTNGKVLCGPAVKPVQTYTVKIEGEIGRVE